MLFDGNDFGNRRGMMGCALSHLKMWRELLVDNDNAYYVIFEDDIQFAPTFKQHFKSLQRDFEQQEVLFMGYSMYENKRVELTAIYDTVNEKEYKIEALNKNIYIGGTFAYSINKVGAKKLVEYIETNGIKHGIDYLMKITPNLNMTELQPQLVFSKWYEAGKEVVDTDIQTNYQSLDFSKTIEDQFEFIPKLDQIGNDLYFQRGLSPSECMIKALKDINCVGFNTLGFFKNKIDTLTSSNYFGEKDGMYIKKTAIPINAEKDDNLKKPVRVKMIGNWCSSEQLCKEWSNMCHEGYKWNHIEMTASDEAVDYYVIINYPRKKPMGEEKEEEPEPEMDTYKPEKTIVFQMEPWIQDPSKHWGVKTWEEWSIPDPAKFFKVFTHKTHLNNVQWQIEYPFHDKPVDNTVKKNQVATICSDKKFDTGHVLRINFIKFIQENKITETEERRLLDVYGKENYHHLKNYVGAVKEENKYNVYANYKYCLAVENNNELNYATEKIWESILCESLCFYWGCPNLEEYIDPRAFVRLPLEDPAAAVNIIQQAVKEDWWSQRIAVIKQMKEKILTELGFFPLLSKLL